LKENAKSVLVLLLKRPLPGQGKQRLAATLGGRAALAIAEGLLECALEDARAWPGPVVLAPSLAADGDWIAARFGAPALWLAQESGNLGQRINRIDRTLRASGAERLLYMGSDAPMLQPRHFQAAASALHAGDVVLSAAADGGVVLMGNARPWPDLGGLPWSSARLGAALARCCSAAGLQVDYVRPGYDVDVAADLQRLRVDLAGDPRPARRHLLALLDAPLDGAPLPVLRPGSAASPAGRPPRVPPP